MPLNSRKVMEKRETRYMKICSWIAANHFIPSCSTIASPVRYTLPVTPSRRRSRGREGNDNESKLMEFPRGHTGLRRILRFEQTWRLRGKTHDGLTFALPAAELTLRQGVATLRARTTTVSFVRYAPPVDQSSATPGYPRSRDFSIGRVPTRTRSKATRPGQLTHIRPPL